MADNITSKNTLKSWFKRGLKPLESQFHAWIDSYWHKDEKIPTATIDGLENILNQKADNSVIDALTEEFSEHQQDALLHKTTGEQSKLDHLADNPDLTYATKEELQAQGNVVITVDLRKATKDEVQQDVSRQIQEYLSDGSHLAKTVYCLFQWFSNPIKATGLNQYLAATELELFGDTEWIRTAYLPEEVLAPWVANAGSTKRLFYVVYLYDGSESTQCELITYNPKKVFKPFYLMISPDDTLYSEYFEKWKGQTRTLTLEDKYQNINETRWTKFVEYFNQEYDIPHVLVSSVMHYVPNGMQPYYPAEIRRIGGFGINGRVTGFAFIFHSVIDYQGRKYAVEEIAEFPNFKGLGSTYNYTINYRPLQPVITVGPTPPENFEDGDIFIQTEG